MKPWHDACESPLRVLVPECLWDELRENLQEGFDELCPFDSSAIILRAH